MPPCRGFITTTFGFRKVGKIGLRPISEHNDQAALVGGLFRQKRSRAVRRGLCKWRVLSATGGRRRTLKTLYLRLRRERLRQIIAGTHT